VIDLTFKRDFSSTRRGQSRTTPGYPALGNRSLGSVPMPLSPAEFKTLLMVDTDKWAKLIRTANIKPQ
jgi:hypothetical protein